MSVKKLLTCRGVRGRKRSATAALVGMLASTFGGNVFVPTRVSAQSTAPVSQGFHLDAGDLRFISEQILVAQDHAAGGTLLGNGPNQVSDPQLPRGLRTVDGSFNNLVPGQTNFGRADLVFPRMLTPIYRPAETVVVAAPGQPVGTPTSYAQKSGT